jgi:hypothetical protein
MRWPRSDLDCCATLNVINYAYSRCYFLARQMPDLVDGVVDAPGKRPQFLPVAKLTLGQQTLEFGIRSAN